MERGCQSAEVHARVCLCSSEDGFSADAMPVKNISERLSLKRRLYSFIKSPFQAPDVMVVMKRPQECLQISVWFAFYF